MEMSEDPPFTQRLHQPDSIKLVVEDPSWIAGFHDFSILAEGATGVVYAAKSDEDNSDVAVKIYKKELIPDSDSAKRFQQEVYALRQLAHPNIVKIISASQTNSGQSFIVMELIDGVNIRTMLETEGVFEPARAVKVIREVCRALEVLHAKGIIHRDLKPNNIVVDSRNVVKIVDFGIAKVIGGTSDTITQYGAVLGTPAYMSPEQCLGQRIDERSDVYSVGCTLFEMLTGMKAFESATAMEALAKQIDDDRSFLEKPLIAANAPSDLRVIIVKSLQREPAARYQNMAALSHDLGAFLIGEPLTFGNKRPAARVLGTTGGAVWKDWSALKHWQVIACCSAFILAAIIIRLNVDSIAGFSTKNQITTPQATAGAPYVIYSRKTREPLYSDPSATTAIDAVVSAIKHHVSLQYADLHEARLFRGNFDGVDFSNADLSNADFTYASLVKANFHGSVVYNASLLQANITGADFSAAQLSSAIFNSASARDANFMGADLSDAQMMDADFRNCNFKNANLSGARLRGAFLGGADLSFAECRETKFDHLRSQISQTNFAGARDLTLPAF